MKTIHCEVCLFWKKQKRKAIGALVITDVGGVQMVCREHRKTGKEAGFLFLPFVVKKMKKKPLTG